ncbi:50S ribosomal protein 6, chloroplastic-like [Cucurbita pepo subsp. pepo]|uniref:50S ribosomal protein 6, chloroplastic-like n=1 Tax=Cucurbita pepo subsp. pepo TaxID=3664 RepID=UPI000C9D4BBA|nr:50S ribosomal protein 6, chloroplastic-like [Cucurbita pepo subsp. pepo]
MSISTFFGCRISVPPLVNPSARNAAAPCSGGSLVIECSSRPNKKATAHHMKTRPRKSQPWDIKRKPTVYPPLPNLPPDWTFVSPVSGDGNVEVASSIASSEQAPSTSE